MDIDINKSRKLIISPHIDDAVFSIGGILGKSETKSIVVDVFSLDSWKKEGIYEKEAPLKIINIRKIEELENSKLLNFDVIFLDFIARWEGKNYRNWQDKITEQDNETIKEIFNSIKALVKDGAFDLMLFPLAIGGHIDHKLCNRVGNLFLNSNYKGKAFYEDLPYALHKEYWELSPNYSQIQSNKFVSTHYDVSNTIKIKNKAIVNYKSQVDSAKATRIINYSKKHGQYKECLWEKTN